MIPILLCLINQLLRSPLLFPPSSRPVPVSSQGAAGDREGRGGGARGPGRGLCGGRGGDRPAVDREEAVSLGSHEQVTVAVMMVTVMLVTVMLAVICGSGSLH